MSKLFIFEEFSCFHIVLYENQITKYIYTNYKLYSYLMFFEQKEIFFYLLKNIS